MKQTMQAKTFYMHIMRTVREPDVSEQFCLAWIVRNGYSERFAIMSLAQERFLRKLNNS